MERTMKKLLAVLVLLTAAAGYAQRTNTFYVDQFAGVTVAAKTTKAKAACRATLPCILIFDPSLKKIAAGSMPARGVNETWLDYRTPGKLLYNGAEPGGGTTTVAADSNHRPNQLPWTLQGSNNSIVKFWANPLHAFLTFGGGTYNDGGDDNDVTAFSQQHLVHGGIYWGGYSKGPYSPILVSPLWAEPLGTLPPTTVGDYGGFGALFQIVAQQQDGKTGVTPGMPIFGINNDYQSNIFTVYGQGNSAFHGIGAAVGINNVPNTYPATAAHSYMPLGTLQVSNPVTDNAKANAVFNAIPELVLTKGHKGQTASMLELRDVNRTTVLASFDKDGKLRIPAVQISGGAAPSCAAANRGQIWYVPGGAGVKDVVEVCAKDATDAYAWRPIY
jgi:hypothetical protein